MIWLSRFGKSRIAQLNPIDIRELRGMRSCLSGAQPPPNRISLETQDAAVCAFITLFETSLGLSLAIPGWEQTSIAEAFLSRLGQSTDFPWT